MSKQTVVRTKYMPKGATHLADGHECGTNATFYFRKDGAIWYVYSGAIWFALHPAFNPHGEFLNLLEIGGSHE